MLTLEMLGNAPAIIFCICLVIEFVLTMLKAIYNDPKKPRYNPRLGHQISTVEVALWIFMLFVCAISLITLICDIFLT